MVTYYIFNNIVHDLVDLLVGQRHPEGFYAQIHQETEGGLTWTWKGYFYYFGILGSVYYFLKSQVAWVRKKLERR